MELWALFFEKYEIASDVLVKILLLFGAAETKTPPSCLR